MTLAAGTRLGSYEILAPLGAGGMGEVYRRFTCSGIRLRHRRAARGHALDRARSAGGRFATGAANFLNRSQGLRETLSRCERS
jgi:hypothetical protein